MSKTIVEEAFEDVKKIKAASLEVASRELVQYLKPELSRLIDEALEGNEGNDDEIDEADSNEPPPRTTAIDEADDDDVKVTGKEEKSVIGNVTARVRAWLERKFAGIDTSNFFDKLMIAVESFCESEAKNLHEDKTDAEDRLYDAARAFFTDDEIDSVVAKITEGRLHELSNADSISVDAAMDGFEAAMRDKFADIETSSFMPILVRAARKFCEAQVGNVQESLEDEREVELLDAVMAYFTPERIDDVIHGAQEVDVASEVTLSESAVGALSNISRGIAATGVLREETLKSTMYDLSESYTRLLAVAKNSGGSKKFLSEVVAAIERVRETYRYIQKRVVDQRSKSLYESRLERLNVGLSKIQERCMKTMKEGKVTLELDGVPDDLDLDDLSVNLISDEDEEGTGEGEEGSDGADLEGSSDDENAPPENAEGGAEGSEDLEGGEHQNEGDKVPGDDEIVEIDEEVVKEALREMKSGVAKNFGGGKDQGDAITEGEDEPIEEGDDEDGEPVDEGCSEEEEESPVREGEGGPDGDLVPEGEYVKGQEEKVTEARKRIAACKNVVKAADKRVMSLKKILESTGKPSAKLNARKMIKEAQETRVRAITSIKKLNTLVESTRASLSRSGSSGPTRSGTPNVKKLQSELAEQKLFNIKMGYALKLSENSTITKAQKKSVFEKLDTAKSLTEAKSIFEGAMSAISLRQPASRTAINESNTRAGAASAYSRTSGMSLSKSPMNEGLDFARWQELAGIRNK